MTPQRDVFLRVYANLPLPARSEVILDLGDEKGGPITWEVAHREVRADSELGKLILKKMLELKLIPTE